MDYETLKGLKSVLKGKRAKFCEEYVIDRNGTQAAIRAGIPEKGAAVQAHRFLLEPEVRAYIAALDEAAAEAAGVNKNNLICKTEEIYRRCMQDKPKMEYDPVSGQWQPVGEYEFDPRGAAKAAELQAKLMGELTEKREIESGGFELIVTTRDDDEKPSF